MKHTKGGFSLVEMGISITLFLIVFTITISAVVAINAASNRMQNTVYAVAAMTHIFDEVTTNARLATKYSCGDTLSPSGSSCNDEVFTFRTKLSDGTDGPQITYRFDSDTGVVEKRVDSGSYIQISPDLLTVEYLNFYIYDGAAGDSKPSRVQVTMGGTYQKNAKEEIEYSLQTTVTQRIVE